MAPFTFDGYTTILVSLAIGFGFGFVLERAGFGDSRRLAAQFYLHDMTVLKVMFTAIVTAMVFVHFLWAVGVLDLSRVYVNPTYLGSGVLGGLIMGVGFIIGGYCPGTSLVAAATLKLDGVFFVLGVFLGVFAFGEVVPSFWNFFEQSGYLGRFTLADWMGLPTSVVTFLVACMAVFMFWGAERIEAAFRREPRAEVEVPDAMRPEVQR